MAIRINGISVKNLGPLTRFDEELSNFNLIYSQNEKGKTFLTEFILRSLFKNHGRWNNIRKGGQGKVWLSGLEDEPVSFSPNSKNKLEDYLEEQEEGIPASIPQILMAKGSEASITPDGINKTLIKEVLSGINILDRIDKDISATVKKASIESSINDINKQGIGKEHNNAEARLKNIEEFIDYIENNFSLGIIQDYKQKLKQLKNQIHQQKEAKKYKAYKLSGELKKINEKLGQYPKEEINQLEQDIRSFRETLSDYTEKEKKYNEEENNSRHLAWLEKAREQYKEWTTAQSGRIKPFDYLPGGIAALATINFIALDMKIPALIAFLATIGGGVYLGRKLYGFTKNYGKNRELQKLKENFRDYTGKELSDLAVLEEELEKRTEASRKANYIKEELDSLEGNLRDREKQINQRLKTLTGEVPEHEEWENKLHELKTKRKELEIEYSDKNTFLNKLDVSETDYKSEDPGIQYTHEQLRQDEDEYERLQEELNQKERELNSMKQRICDLTGDEIHLSWTDIMENLRKEKEKQQEELRELRSGIVAGNLVHNLIQEFREQEDQRIKEGLASDYVTQPLYELTKSYNALSMKDDQLIISDDTGDYTLNDLSTGTREQIMLALRIGFSHKIIRKEPLFLILDDTFQHSDWNRREVLVNKLAEITGLGWQVIYFTMDDHIHDLFQKAGNKMNGGFRNINLDEI